VGSWKCVGGFVTQPQTQPLTHHSNSSALPAVVKTSTLAVAQRVSVDVSAVLALGPCYKTTPARSRRHRRHTPTQPVRMWHIA
jgi:hypothetical protein